jgi:hypothetical protein
MIVPLVNKPFQVWHPVQKHIPIEMSKISWILCGDIVIGFDKEKEETWLNLAVVIGSRPVSKSKS